MPIFATFLVVLVGGFARRNSLGRVFFEPYHVRLPGMKRRRSPDLFFVSNDRLGLLEEDQFRGAPNQIIEIVSKDSQSRDRRVKFKEYEKAGVDEYWLVDPRSRRFEAFHLDQNGSYARLAESNGPVYSESLPGLSFDPTWVFQIDLPDPIELIAEMGIAHRKAAASVRRPRRSDRRSR